MKYVFGGIILFFSMGVNALTLDDLKGSTIFAHLYSHIFDAPMEDSRDLDEDQLTVGVEDSELAIYNEPESYLNIDGEQRFLVHIERREIEKNPETHKYEFSQISHASTADNDIFIFKKTPQGKYLLVSQTNEKFLPFGNDGISHLNISRLNERVVKLKPNTVGFFNTVGFVGQGYYEEFLVAVVLNEKQPIIALTVSPSAGDADGVSDKVSSFESTWKVLDDEPTVGGYYPIKVIEKHKEENERGKVENDKQIKIYAKKDQKESYTQIFPRR